MKTAAASCSRPRCGTSGSAADSYRTKLTLVYHDGGVPLLTDTIEQSFGVEIDGYILVNYLGVIQVVDAVGGLDMELSAEEIHYMDVKIRNLCELTGASYEENLIPAQEGGTLRLNGIQTAAYLRPLCGKRRL